MTPTNMIKTAQPPPLKCLAQEWNVGHQTVIILMIFVQEYFIQEGSHECFFQSDRNNILLERCILKSWTH